MSTLEKNLYKNLKVNAQQRTYENPIAQRAYRGISTTDPNKKDFKVYDLDLIRQDILNHFHIRLGEKLENPAFGTIIWDVLYEPFTDVIRDAIVRNVTEIINYDPRVKVDRVVVDTFESGIQVQCEITYLDYSISEYIQLEFDRDNGLI
jgi:phage baseplate assembly protein W